MIRTVQGEHTLLKTAAASPATAATAASRIEPLIGVEELLQAATVQDSAADQAATVAGMVILYSNSIHYQCLAANEEWVFTL